MTHEERANSIIQDFKNSQHTEMDLKLLSQWCKDIALDKAKESLFNTIEHLTIFDIMKLKQEIDNKINGKPKKEPKNVTKAKKVRRNGRKVQKKAKVHKKTAENVIQG